MKLLYLLAQIDRRQVDIPQGDLTLDRITDILQFVFGMAGGVALIIIVIGGFNYATSQGSPEKTLKARNTIIYALIGLIICMSAFAIVTFVIGRI